MKKKLQNNLIISSIITLIILGLILISINTLNINETKVFTANKINQKTSEVPQNREVVNIPDKNLKRFLLEGFKNNYGMLAFKFVNDENYIKPENETEIYKDEMEKIEDFYYRDFDEYVDFTGLETAINLEKLGAGKHERKFNTDRISNINVLRKLKKLKSIRFTNYDIEDISSLNKIESLEELELQLCSVNISQINEFKELKNKLKNLKIKYLDLLIIPEKNKFNIPKITLKNGKVVDIIKEYEDFLNGFGTLFKKEKNVLKKNRDGTYYLNKKFEKYLNIIIKEWAFLPVTKISKIGDTNFEELDIGGITVYPPKSNYKETETITKTVKDKSENILNTENEKKLKAVLKRNGKIIDVKPITNIGHRKNAKQLIEFKFNNLRVYEDAKENEVLKEYNYEVEITGEDLSEGYKLEKNNKSDGNDGDYVVTYISPKIDATFKLVYQGIGGDDEKPKVNIRLTRNGVAFGDVVTINGEYEYIFKGIDKTDEKEKPYKYGVEVVGEVTGYDATISADGNTVILTKKIEKGKILPYAGPKTNILFGIVLLVIIGYAVKVFSNQRRINNIKKIKGIKR